MLEYLNVEGKVVTADAMHCHKETCRKIIEKRGDYVLGLKNNNPTFCADVALYFSAPQLQEDMEYHKTFEKKPESVWAPGMPEIGGFVLAGLPGRTERLEVCVCYWSNGGNRFKANTWDWTLYLQFGRKRRVLDGDCTWTLKIKSMYWILDVIFPED